MNNTTTLAVGSKVIDGSGLVYGTLTGTESAPFDGPLFGLVHVEAEDLTYYIPMSDLRAYDLAE